MTKKRLLAVQSFAKRTRVMHFLAWDNSIRQDQSYRPLDEDELEHVAQQYNKGDRLKAELERLNKRAPISTIIQRTADMGDGSLRLYIEDDGDVELTVLTRDPRKGLQIATVQFCMPMSGGGRSPETIKALKRLAAAMVEDGNEWGR